MGRKRDYQAGLFDELEKLNQKLDKLLKENKEQSLTIYNLNLTIKDLTKQLNQVKELNQKLVEENEKLKNQNKIEVRTITHTIKGNRNLKEEG